MRALWAVAAQAVILTSASGLLAEQGVSAPESQAFTESVSVGYVLVPVAVRSRDGWVTSLGRSDFRLTVDGRETPIESFEHGSDSPVHLVFLQDLSGSMALGGALGLSRLAVECFLERGDESDEFALATFADRRLFLDVPFTARREVLREAMESWQAFGVTALYDAVAELPRIAPTRGAAKRAVILITDGAENASETQPEEATRIVRGAQLPVYVLSLERSGRRARSDRSEESATFAGLLRALAVATGGGYHALAWPADGERSCAEILAELRSRYILGFATGDGGDQRYREIRVEVPRTGLMIRHRAGYRGHLPAGGPVR